MAVKGRATVTLTSYRDTQSVTRYYKLQITGSSAPLKPETKPPSSDWTDSEPDCDISKELYFCDLTIFSNGEWEYSSVSKSSSYEAAKEAYNKAQNASETLKIESARIDNLESTKADITSLNAGIARIDTLETGKADIDLANVNNAWITNGVIKDASIANEKVISVSANKLTAGTIDASKITVTNLNADNITVGTINGARIGNNSIDLNKLSQEVPTKEYLDSVEQKLQGEIDGAIETFTVSEIPTLNNEPAVNWTTDNIKSTHVGDLCYVVNNTSDKDGFCYRFQYNGIVYSWALIKDNDVTKAIQDIAELNGEVTQFKTDYTSKVSEIDGGIESLKSRTTTIETTYSTKTYTDTKTSDALTSANSYADNKASSTLTEANSYADNKASTTLSSAKTYADSTASSTLGEAKSYTDTATADMATTGDIPTKVSELTNDSSFATTTQVSNAKSEAISTASADATNKANSALDSAKSYTDSVEIGGRNLFIDSQKMAGYLGAGQTYGNLSAQNSVNKEWTSQDISCSEGDSFVLQVWRTVPESVTSQLYWRAYQCYANDNSLVGGRLSWNDDVTIDSNGVAYSVNIITIPEGASKFRFSARLYSDGIVKIEKGNKATDWTPAPEDVDAGIANAQTVADTAESKAEAINSKGEQLVINGNAILGNNTNFTQWLYDGSMANGSGGSFTLSPGTRKTIINDEFFGLDPLKDYRFEFDAISKESTSKHYSMLVFYDVDKKEIMALNHKYISEVTELAVDLKNGDTVVHLNDISSFNTNTGTHSYERGFIFWNYTNSFGYTYPPKTYSRNVLQNLWEDSGVNKADNTIALKSPWSKGTIPAGTKLSQCSDGANYKYQPLGNSVVPSEWTHYSCVYSGTDYSGTNISSKFPPGTAYCKVGFLWNYGNFSSTDQLWITNVSVYEDYKTGIANAQKTADTAKTNAATAQSTANTAKANAATAQSTADTAKSNAAAAQTAASNAQTTANEAKAKAEAAQTAVSTKVETSVFNTLKNTVDENSANITSLTETVTTKADSSTVTTLSNTVNEVKQTADENSSSISNLTTTVNSKADGSKVTALENKTSTIEQNLSGVTTRVTNLESENDGLDTRLTTAESKITADAIVSTVTSSKTYKDALSGKVDTSVYNTKMEQLDNSISLKATATDVYTKTQTEEFVTSQGYLTVTSDAITSKVSKNEVISAINQTAESVSINANKINLNGAVTFSSFDNSLQTTINNKAETSALEGVRTVATNAATVATNFMSYNDTDGLIIGNKTGGSFVGSRAQVLPDSFNILDTDGTKRASFGETTVIGDTDKANLYLTYNELYMEDKDDKVFFKVGDYRGSTGVATLTYTDTRSVNVSAGRVYVALSIPAKIESVISVVVEGTTISEDNYRFSINDDILNDEVVDHTTSMWVEGLTYKEGDKVEVEVTYTTKSPYSYYVFGLPDNSLTPGRFSSSEGWCTRASGEYTHAEGKRSVASGYASHAEGSSYACGYMSHAEGTSTANGGYSHAEGNSATGKNAKFSHAEGDNTVAASESQHVSGAFNIIDNDGKYAFIIGNGSNFSSRSNAMTIDWDGVPTFYGMAGEIKMWAGDRIPTGWLLCDGSEVSKTDYPYLYAAIGDLWGTPNSSSNFKLPNLTGRVPVGYNSADTDTTETFGKVGATGGARGAWYHTHTIGSSGAHHHASQGRMEGSGSGANIFESYNGASKTRSVNVPRTGDNGAHTHSPGSSGSSGNKLAVDKANMPPYAVVKYIICAI